MPIIIVILMYGTWSSVFPLSKLALELTTPLFLTGTRMLFSGLILMTVMLFKDRKQLKLKKQHIIPLFVLAISSIYLTNILESWSIKHLSSAKACFIYGFSPFLTVGLSYLHFGEKLNKTKLLGMMLGLIGFLPVLLMQTEKENAHIAFGVISWPELAMFGAAFFSTYGWVLLRVHVKNYKLSPLTTNAYIMLIGGSISLFHSLLIDSWSPVPVSDGYATQFLIYLLIISLVCNVICYNWYGFLLKRYTATFISFCGLSSPIFVSLFSWFLANEALSWTIFFSSIILSLGLGIIYQSELRQGYILRQVSKVS